ncbi:MAG TPA: elongation factor Ts [Patescibacteria group bacterium]|nr:elongation factor Ts [Patescibacteria group bacterium]
MAVKISADDIRKVKEETGSPVIRAKAVLEEQKGDIKKAIEILRKEGFEKTQKRAGRETKAGILSSYVHHTQKVIGIAEVFCETDFVAKNELFQQLGKDIAMQVASMGEKDILDQEFIKDPSKKISDLLKEVIAKTGENVVLGRVMQISLGEK